MGLFRPSTGCIRNSIVFSSRRLSRSRLNERVTSSGTSGNSCGFDSSRLSASIPVDPTNSSWPPWLTAVTRSLRGTFPGTVTSSRTSRIRVAFDQFVGTGTTNGVGLPSSVAPANDRSMMANSEIRVDRHTLHFLCNLGDRKIYLLCLHRGWASPSFRGTTFNIGQFEPFRCSQKAFDYRFLCIDRHVPRVPLLEFSSFVLVLIGE